MGEGMDHREGAVGIAPVHEASELRSCEHVCELYHRD